MHIFLIFLVPSHHLTLEEHFRIVHNFDISYIYSDKQLGKNISNEKIWEVKDDKKL